MKCECGRDSFIKSTGQCARCYHREYGRKRKPQPSAIALGKYPSMPVTTPCSYNVAHQRVAYWRGKAKTHTCECGAPAEHWSYRGGSTWEQTGLVKKMNRPNPMLTKWSSHVMDYDALCIECHSVRDEGWHKPKPSRDQVLLAF